ncbi:MAG: helix-turn-helix domain-containing protein [Aliivibrio sp.]|nr:helix-turn-helix domain-containing protein [Aliivibrio sp.]
MTKRVIVTRTLSITRATFNRQLLQHGTSLVETASQLGFADQSHFQRHFKRRLAITPKQYQGFFI